ncbi:MAG: hypothetical protein ACOY90_15290 [Candidatus Zhuqueibacterota bacterium]
MKNLQSNRTLETQLYEEINQLAGYLESTKFMGWEPYDSPALFPGMKRMPGAVRMLWVQLNRISPIPIFRFFKEPKLYSKAMALLAHTYLLLFKITEDAKYRGQAIIFLDWLMKNRSSATTLFSMGTHYNIAMKGYAATGETPSPLITCMAVEAFMSAYEILGEPRYLELARSGVDYFLNDLPQQRVSDTESFFNYHPNNPKFIPNLPAVLCGTFARFLSFKSDPGIMDAVIKNFNYVVRWQRADGSWLYDKNAPYVDNFHTGFILEALLKFRHFTGDTRYQKSLQFGIDYWRSRLFARNGKPIHRILEGRPNNADALLTRIDTRDCAQSLVVSSYLLDESDAAVDFARNIFTWTAHHFKSRQGYFYYQQLPVYKLKGPFISMQAWMLFGMAQLLDAIKKVRGKDHAISNA